jgi:serine phosphatase RsbU (regulator of sigma subunit)
MVMLKGDEVLVSDLGSTNGTFVDGEKVTGIVTLPVGGLLQVGSRMLRHEWRTRAEIDSSNEFDRDLQQAASYVRALLPPVSREGAVKADWAYYPSAKLGGDAFGYGHLRDDLYSCYLIDVAGHGAGSAMHAVAIMNQLRQKSLPNTDMAQPERVLSALNELFQMEDHAGLYFTIWYGVYDQATRRLVYASGGHHPAYILPAGGGEVMPLRTRNIMIGAMPAMNFSQASVDVPPGARMYVFSDGVFEIIDKQGRQWGIDQFLDLLRQPPVEGLGEPQRLYREVRSQVPGGTFDDDFSLVVFDFD